MIKNIVFDMGGVLIEYNPKLFFKRMGLNKTESDIFLREITNSIYWKKHDKGIIDMRNCLDDMLLNIPDYLKEKAKYYILNWTELSNVNDGIVDLLTRLKDNKYNIYLLSNAGVDFVEYFPKYNLDQYFDGKVVSAFYKCVKPNKEIFDILINKYNLNKNETIFIDDMKRNVLGSLKAGIKAIRYQDTISLMNALKEEGINI